MALFGSGGMGAFGLTPDATRPMVNAAMIRLDGTAQARSNGLSVCSATGELQP
jgi:hypothetical protein